MINKFFKTIHNKFPKFFKFFFFLKYVLTIFFIAIFLFLLLPNFFNFDKKFYLLKNYLIKDYGLEISNYDTIKYKSFPFPNLFIKNVKLKIKDKPIYFETKDLKIFLNFKNIYNYENFKAKKLVLSDNKISLQTNEIKEAFRFFEQLKQIQ